MAPASGTISSAVTGPSVAPFAITSTWTAPTQCAQSVGGLTMLEVDEYKIWLNPILPVPGMTVTSCYPSQYISSFLLQAGGISQAAMSPLVCPAGYTTQGPFTSNYIACCPSGWDGLALASNAPSDRPAFGGTCYTNIYNIPISVSVYDNSALEATSIFTDTDTSAQAFASPYEGFALGVVLVSSTTGTGSVIPSATASSSTSSSSTTASSAATGHSHKLSGGAIAGIVIGVLAGLALIALATFFILRHRRKNMKGSQVGEREFQYGGQPDRDPNPPNAGYYNSDLKKDFPPMSPPAEVYGSQDVKNHGEPQELGTQNRVHEMGVGNDEQNYHEMGGSVSENEKRLPDLPSPASPNPVSPKVYR